MKNDIIIKLYKKILIKLNIFSNITSFEKEKIVNGLIQNASEILNMNREYCIQFVFLKISHKFRITKKLLLSKIISESKVLDRKNKKIINILFLFKNKWINYISTTLDTDILAIYHSNIKKKNCHYTALYAVILQYEQLPITVVKDLLANHVLEGISEKNLVLTYKIK